MASRIFHGFKNNALAILRGGWANRVARRCSYWANGTGMACTFPDSPDEQNPQTVALDVKQATNLIYQQMLENGQLSEAVPILTLRPITDESGTLKVAAIFLPEKSGTPTVTLGGTEYTITSGLQTLDAYCDTGSGVTQFPNWYVITERTTGDFWLNSGVTNGNPTTIMTIDAAKSATAGAVSFYIGSIAAGGAVTQWQCKAAGDPIVVDEATVSREVNTAKIDASGSSFDEANTPSPIPQGYAKLADTIKWNIGNKGTGTEANKEVGCKLSVITRTKYEPDNGETFLYCREITISKAGIITAVSEEKKVLKISA